MNRRNVCLSVAVASVLALSLPSLRAQAQGKYPDRPIRLVVPFAPGGGTDIMGRRFANKITPLLGQNVIVDNKGGADGSIGSAEVARAKPDGYTLLVGTSSSHAINPLMENLSYDPVKDFASIALVGIVPMVLAVHPSVANSLPELIKRVKASPGKYSYGSTGFGGIVHLAGELFKKQTGDLDIVNVPYKGSGPSVMDLIAGQIPMVIATYSTVAPYHRSGKLRILAAFTEKRTKHAPDIPTAIELGVPEVTAYTFSVLCAPARTPKPIIDQLYLVTMKVMGDEAFQKELEGLGIEPVTDSSPEKATQFLKDELAKWAPIIKASGAKVH